MPRNIVFLFVVCWLFCLALIQIFGGNYQPPATRSNTIEFHLITAAMFGWMLFAVDGETAADIRVSVVFGIGALFLLTAWLTGTGLDELFAWAGKTHYSRLKTQGFGFLAMGLAILLRRMLASMGYGGGDAEHTGWR